MGFPNDFIIENKQKYLQKVLKDLKKVGIVKDEELIDYHSVIMDPAYVHINQKGIQSVEKYKKQLAQDNIYSIGRYGSWTYCSIEDNIVEAKDLTNKLNLTSNTKK